jgi:hypothetical protein
MLFMEPLMHPNEPPPSPSEPSGSSPPLHHSTATDQQAADHLLLPLLHSSMFALSKMPFLLSELEKAHESKVLPVLWELLESHRHLRILERATPTRTPYAPPSGIWPPRWLRIVGFARANLQPLERDVYRAACHYLAIQHYTKQNNAAARRLKRMGAWDKMYSGSGMVAFVGPLCEFFYPPVTTREWVNPKGNVRGEANVRAGEKCWIRHPTGHCFLDHSMFVGPMGMCAVEGFGIKCPGCEDISQKAHEKWLEALRTKRETKRF